MEALALGDINALACHRKQSVEVTLPCHHTKVIRSDGNRSRITALLTVARRGNARFLCGGEVIEHGFENTVLYNGTACGCNALTVKWSLDGRALAHRVVDNVNERCRNLLALFACQKRQTELRILCRKSRGEYRQELTELLAVKHNVLLARGSNRRAHFVQGSANGFLCGFLYLVKGFANHKIKILLCFFSVAHNGSGIGTAHTRAIGKRQSVRVIKAYLSHAGHCHRLCAVGNLIALRVGLLLQAQSRIANNSGIGKLNLARVDLCVFGRALKNEHLVIVIDASRVCNCLLNELLHSILS